jgi:hypothetical protein
MTAMEQGPAERIAELESLVALMRHDVRSALAPAMLAADLLHGHADPKVQRSAANVVRSIERVLEMLDASQSAVPPRHARDDKAAPSVP